MKKADSIVPEGMEEFYNHFHFSPAVKDVDRLFCSGVIGFGEDGQVIADPRAQFERAFESLGAVLHASAVGFSDICDLLTFHVGLRQHLELFMSVKDRYLSEPYAAWTAIGISELAVPGALVEIKAVARLPK